METNDNQTDIKKESTPLSFRQVVGIVFIINLLVYIGYAIWGWNDIMSHPPSSGNTSQALVSFHFRMLFNQCIVNLVPGLLALFYKNKRKVGLAMVCNAALVPLIIPVHYLLSVAIGF